MLIEYSGTCVRYGFNSSSFKVVWDFGLKSKTLKGTFASFNAKAVKRKAEPIPNPPCRYPTKSTPVFVGD